MSKLLTEFKSEFDQKRATGESTIIELYRHLFSLLSDDELTKALELWFDEYKSNNGWYYQFHKSLRQGDFFTNIHAYRLVDKLTDDERKRRNDLLLIRRKEFNDYEKEFPNDEDLIEYKKFNSQPNRIESFNELKKLNSIMNTEEKLSICGHLDMLLWNAIHLDDKDVLKDIFERTFKLCS